MNKFLDRENPLVQNGANLANVAWAVTNITLATQDPMLGMTFPASNYVGAKQGQTSTGMIHMMSLCLAGYCQMAATGWSNNQYGTLATGAAGILIAGCGIADNWDGSRYAKWRGDKVSAEDNNSVEEIKKRSSLMVVKDCVADVLDKPGKMLQKGSEKLSHSSNSRVKRLGENMIDITQRPNFRASVIGAAVDAAYAAEGLVERNYLKALIGTGWIAAWGMFAVATPKDGQKNIFTQWYETARDKIQSARASDKNKPDGLSL